MDLVIQAPYPEGAITAIAAAADRHAHLQMITPSQAPSQLAKSILQTIGDRNRAGRLARGSRTTNQTRVGAPLDVVRLGVAASGSHALQRSWMYASAQIFDALAARAVQGTPDAVVAMPGAARSTFTACGGNTVRVWHAVNAHPVSHNEILQHHFGKAAAGELIPSWIVRRQAQELELASIVLTPSQQVNDQMIQNAVDPRKIVTIPYGTTIRAASGPAVARSSRSRPQVLYVGQVSYRKGIPYLLQAARAVPQADFTMAGPVVARELLRDLPSNVTYLGPVPHDRVRSLMMESDVFVLPTIEDACALVTLEAASAGLPVVTTTANGASGLVGGDDVTLLEPDDQSRLVDVLRNAAVQTGEQREARIARVAASASVTSWDDYGERVVSMIVDQQANLGTRP